MSIIVYMWTAEGTTSDSLDYVFGCYVFYREEMMETAWQVKNFVKKTCW